MPDNKQYERVKEITDQLEAGIADLFNSEQYVTWLNTMSKFHDYSLNNTILIAMQKPDATLVAGYTAWQKQFGRQVQKGEKAIRILAPTPYLQKVEMEKIDPVTQKPVLDANGDPVKEETEVKRLGFKVTSVFDVSQTQGRELPRLGVDELTGNVKDYDLFFEALKRTCPVPMGFEDIEGGAKGYYHQVDRRIAIQKGMSEIQTIKTAIHEMTHQKLHAIDPDKKVSDMPKLTRNGKEIEAESVAYTVCQHFGIETSDYSFAYVAGWSHGKETPELKASLMTIRKAASEMIGEIEEQIRVLYKEREATMTVEDKAMRLAEKLDDLADDFDHYEYADSVDDREAHILSVKQDLLTDERAVAGILSYLEEIVEENDDYRDQANGLIAEIKALRGEIAEQTVQAQPERTERAQTLTFYVAECMEFTNLGEYHEVGTLEEAMELYKQIPPDRVNGIPGIGFILHEDGIYDGSTYGMMQGDEMQWDMIKMVPHFAESAAIGQAMARCEGLLSDYNLIHSNPAFSQEQIAFMTEMSHQGHSLESFWVNGQPMNLVAAPLSAEEVAHIRYQVDVDAIPKMLYDNEQWRQIQSGIQQELPVRVYADPAYSAQQMDMIKRALITESHGYISMEDVQRIADPVHSADEMKSMLRDIRKESMHRMESERETIDPNAGRQENGHYRYYSTQRPVGPGTYPKDGAEVVGIQNFDSRQQVDGKLLAWGYVEYKEPLTPKQMSDYELRPAAGHAARQEIQAEKPAAKAVERSETGANVPKAQTQKKKSVLADLRAKQAMIAGTSAPNKAQMQMKEELR